MRARARVGDDACLTPRCPNRAVPPRQGYRNDHTAGLAVGDEPESMYAVMGAQWGALMAARRAHSAAAPSL